MTKKLEAKLINTENLSVQRTESKFSISQPKFNLASSIRFTMCYIFSNQVFWLVKYILADGCCPLRCLIVGTLIPVNTTVFSYSARSIFSSVQKKMEGAKYEEWSDRLRRWRGKKCVTFT